MGQKASSVEAFLLAASEEFGFKQLEDERYSVAAGTRCGFGEILPPPP